MAHISYNVQHITVLPVTNPNVEPQSCPSYTATLIQLLTVVCFACMLASSSSGANHQHAQCTVPAVDRLSSVALSASALNYSIHSEGSTKKP